VNQIDISLITIGMRSIVSLPTPIVGYRRGIYSLRKEASRISEQTEHLLKAVADLQTEADLMRSFEQQLSKIARKQGYTANEILSLMKENEEILQKQKVIVHKLSLALGLLNFSTCSSSSS
jgi:hypothetical protein